MPAAEFSFAGHARWQLFFATPNGAALALSLCLPVVWMMYPGVHDRRPPVAARVALFLLEALIWFALAKTYSRGGYVAALCGMSAFHLLAAGRAGRSAWSSLLARSALAAAMCALTGLGARSSIPYIMSDASVLHRVDVWRGACKLISASPWTGWGFGNSGKFYVNWIQDGSAVHTYKGVLNLFLQVAAEEGLLSGFILVAVVLVGVAFPLAGRSALFRAHLAAASALLIWAVANQFSTLGEDVLLYVLPAAWAVVAFDGVRRLAPGPRLRLAAVCGTAAAFVWAAVFAYGLDYQHAWHLRNLGGRGIAVSHGQPDEAVDLYLDLRVLGRVPGQRIRQAMLDQGGRREVRVWNRSADKTERTATAVFFGRTCRLPELRDYGRVVLVNPPADAAELLADRPHGRVQYVVLVSGEQSAAAGSLQAIDGRRGADTGRAGNLYLAENADRAWASAARL
jgi:hypothetical protein